MDSTQSRRHFLTTLSTAGAAGIFGSRRSLADEGPPETITIRLSWYPNICLAPGFISKDLLRAEGFTDVRYVRNTSADSVARGETDFDFDTAAWVVAHLDAGEPILALSGVHSGCYELFAHEPIRAISDLKGKKLGIYELGKSGHLLLQSLRHRSASTLTGTSSGSRAPPPWSCSRKVKSMPFSGTRRSHRSCAPARSVG